MIVAGISNGKTGRQGILIGISYQNLERLKTQPIVIDENHPAGKSFGIDFLLFAGETEQSIFAMLVAKGFITPETALEMDPNAIKDPSDAKEPDQS